LTVRAVYLMFSSTSHKRSKKGLISMKSCCAIILICLYGLPLYASEVMPFTAECVAGETHRYDGGNGKDMMGKKIQSPQHGWSTERLGNLSITWSGGKTIVMDNLNATVTHAEGGVISAVWSGAVGKLAVNIYSMVLDTSIGQAVHSQVQASSLGESRQIKVRSEHFHCKIKWLN